MEGLPEVAIIAIAGYILGYYINKLDSNYVCPVYCEVDHRHIYEEKTTEKGNVPTVDGVHKSAGATSKE